MRARQIFPLLIGLLLAACSAQTQLTNTWRDTEFRGVPFKRVLVIGFGEDGANRRVFEDEFSKSLQAAGVSAIPSYTLGSGVSETDIEKVKAMVALVSWRTALEAPGGM